MDYQRASLIRGTSLSGLIGERYSAGQGFGSSIGGAITDKLKAKAVGLKERIDPLNMVRKLTGQGAFGNIMTAVAGRALGRSQRDISYFGGYTRRRSMIPSLNSKEDGGDTRGRGNSKSLEKIYQFLKRSTDERKRAEQLNRAFRREQVNEDERRHQDLVEAIKGFTGEVTAKPVEEKGNGFLDTVRSMITGAIDNIMNSFSWLKDLKNNIIGFFRLFTNSTLSLFTRLIPLLGNPMFLAVVAGAATIYELMKLMASLSEITPDFKQLSPSEARAALESEDEIVAQAKKRYKTENVTTQQIQETKEYLENRVLKGKEEAERINQIQDKEIREKAVRDFGGEALLKKTLEDQNVYTLPTEEELKNIKEKDLKGKPEKVEPRPIITPASGLRGEEKQRNWDKKYAKSHDPTTGIRLDLLNKETVIPAGESTAGAGRGSVAGPTAADMSGVPTAIPAGESTAGAGRGSVAGPTAADMSGVPTPSPTPVPKNVPDITPMPELSSYMDSSQPIIQTNTNNNMINGSRDRVLATSPAKQRNTDLNRFLVRSSVPV